MIMNTELIHIIKLKYRKHCYTAVMSCLYEIKTTGTNVRSYIEVSLAAHWGKDLGISGSRAE